MKHFRAVGESMPSFSEDGDGMKHIEQEVYNDGTRSIVARAEVPDGAVLITQPPSGHMAWAMNSAQPSIFEQNAVAEARQMFDRVRASGLDLWGGWQLVVPHDLLVGCTSAYGLPVVHADVDGPYLGHRIPPVILRSR